MKWKTEYSKEYSASLSMYLSSLITFLSVGEIFAWMHLSLLFLLMKYSCNYYSSVLEEQSGAAYQDIHTC